MVTADETIMPAASAPASTGRRRSILGHRQLWAVVATVAVVLPVWPGVFTIDSQVIVADARSGDVSDWYAPIHGRIIGVVDRVGLGPSALYLLSVLGFCLALGMFVGRIDRSGWSGPITLAVVLFPPVYGLLGWFGRDVWATGYVLVFLCVVHDLMAESPMTRRHFIGLCGVAVALALAAADARQNLLFLLPIASIVVAWRARGIVPRLHSNPRALVFALAISAVFGSAFVLVRSAAVETSKHPEQVLYHQDLLAISFATDQLRVPGELIGDDDLSRLRSETVARSPAYASQLFGSDPPLLTPISAYEEGAAERFDLLSDAWRTAIRDEPLAYLHGRVSLWAAQYGVTRPAQSWYFRGSDDIATASGEFAQRWSAPNEWRIRYFDAFSSTGPVARLVGSALVQLSVLVIGAWVASRMDRRSRATWAVIVAINVLVMSTLFVTAPTFEARFTFPHVVLAASVVAVTIASRREVVAAFRRMPTPLATSTRPGEHTTIVTDHEGRPEQSSVDRPT